MENATEALTLQLKAATELLEKVAVDRAALGGLSDEDRARLFAAAQKLCFPNPIERRRMVKARIRARRVAKEEKLQTKLNQTGIRALRREKVFMTPNVFPPANFKQL